MKVSQVRCPCCGFYRPRRAFFARPIVGRSTTSLGKGQIVNRLVAFEEFPLDLQRQMRLAIRSLELLYRMASGTVYEAVARPMAWEREYTPREVTR